MKKIEAIIRRSRFEDVKEALLAADIEWFSYYDVRGIGKTREGRIYRGVVYDTSSIERILLSIVVRDKNVEKTVQAIMQHHAVRTYRRDWRRAHLYPARGRLHPHPHRRAGRHLPLQRRTGEISKTR